MPRASLYVVLYGFALAFLVPAAARAQEYAGPPANSPYDRAYQRFLNSPDYNTWLADLKFVPDP